MIKNVAISNIIPITNGKSRQIKESTSNLPIPFQPKIYSIKTVPDNMPANQPELAVTTEESEFLNA